jgi:hypothetical protein
MFLVMVAGLVRFIQFYSGLFPVYCRDAQPFAQAYEIRQDRRIVCPEEYVVSVRGSYGSAPVARLVPLALARQFQRPEPALGFWEPALVGVRYGYARAPGSAAQGRVLRGCAVLPGRQPTRLVALASAADVRARWLPGKSGDLDELRTRADADDRHAAPRLAMLLAWRGDLDGLRARTDADDEFAAWWLAQLLADRGDLDGLRARADTDDRDAAERLADLLADVLAQRGDLDGLQARADTGDNYAIMKLADLLADRGDLDELRTRADAGDWSRSGPVRSCSPAKTARSPAWMT